MKIAVLSDIHGNHYATEAVLKDCLAAGIEHLLILGDIVGYYYHPEIVLDLLSAFPYDIIKGNHEVILQGIEEGKINSKDNAKKYGEGHQMALKNLNRQKIQWLYSLPSQKSVILDSVAFQLNHGSPWNSDEYLYPDTSNVILERCNSVNHDFVLVGHSHYAFAYKCKDSVLINCGSVGQSRQKGGVATWVMVNTVNKCFEIKTTSYNTSDLLKEINTLEGNATYSSKILLR